MSCFKSEPPTTLQLELYQTRDVAGGCSVYILKSHKEQALHAEMPGEMAAPALAAYVVFRRHRSEPSLTKYADLGCNAKPLPTTLRGQGQVQNRLATVSARDTNPDLKLGISSWLLVT